MAKLKRMIPGSYRIRAQSVLELEIRKTDVQNGINSALTRGSKNKQSGALVFRICTKCTEKLARWRTVEKAYFDPSLEKFQRQRWKLSKLRK
jgi:hypothetical protein